MSRALAIVVYMSDKTITLLTWNMRHGGGDRVRGITNFLASQHPDIAVLTEYRPRRECGRFLRDALRVAGWEHLAESPHAADDNAVLIASRTPLVRVDSYLPLDVPVEARSTMRARWVEAQIPGWTIPASSPTTAPVPLTIAGVHVPGSGDKMGREGKRRFWQAMLDMAANRSDIPMMMMGDFNTGLALDEGGPTPFDCKEYMMRLHEDFGWRDAWRSRHEGVREYTWYSNQGGGYRLDYAWLSPVLQDRLRNADHVHDVRAVTKLSDHAALSVEISLIRA